VGTDRGGPRRGPVAAAWPVGVAAVLTFGALLAGCTAGPATPAPGPVEAAPPAPPAACLLDTAAFATSTRLAWRPDATTASDTRCVYGPGEPPPTDPGAPAPAQRPDSFLAVEVTPVGASDTGTELDTVAAVCADGSRAPVAVDGFVCRFRGGSVFAALLRSGRLVTISVSAVPEGTDAAHPVVGLRQQLETLGR
jgi:hypothetical protein